MFKFTAVALAVVSFGLLGAAKAEAGCGCSHRGTTAVAAAPAQASVAQAPGVRSTRSFSYEPSNRSYRAPTMMRGNGSTNPSYRADHKALGR